MEDDKSGTFQQSPRLLQCGNGATLEVPLTDPLGVLGIYDLYHSPNTVSVALISALRVGVVRALV